MCCLSMNLSSFLKWQIKTLDSYKKNFFNTTCLFMKLREGKKGHWSTQTETTVYLFYCSILFAVLFFPKHCLTQYLKLTLHCSMFPESKFYSLFYSRNQQSFSNSGYQYAKCKSPQNRHSVRGDCPHINEIFTEPKFHYSH
jgi:hypothetical protein